MLKDSSMALGRDTSNQSTVDSGSGSGLSMNSHPDLSAADPHTTRRLFTLTSATGADMQRRLRLIIDQCETVRFPFKKRLILANLSLSHDDIPVQDICSERLGTALYKLSLAGNEILSIPEPLVLKLTGLRVLDVSQCGLQFLPDRWDLPSLRKLVVSHNRIQTFPSEVSNPLSLV
jgi:Leucine-rich repeat (LRR) protein